jgi:hypothetical protein
MLRKVSNEAYETPAYLHAAFKVKPFSTPSTMASFISGVNFRGLPPLFFIETSFL